MNSHSVCNVPPDKRLQIVHLFLMQPFVRLCSWTVNNAYICTLCSTSYVLITAYCQFIMHGCLSMHPRTFNLTQTFYVSIHNIMHNDKRSNWATILYVHSLYVWHIGAWLWYNLNSLSALYTTVTVPMQVYVANIIRVHNHLWNLTTAHDCGGKGSPSSTNILCVATTPAIRFHYKP